MKEHFTRCIPLTIILLLAFQYSFCQVNYLPGYIIRLNGDSIHGWVDYRNWERNPDKINFKETETSEKSVFSPMDIKGFSVKDEIYISAIVQSEISPTTLKELDWDAKLTFRTDTTFLQTLVRGNKSLYLYINKMSNPQFYIKQGLSFELLVHKKYYRPNEKAANGYKPSGIQGQYTLAENKKYIGQLLLYLQDCPDIQSKLNGAEYSQGSLEKLFNFYYTCTKSGIAFEKKSENLIAKFGLIAGISMTEIHFSGKDFPYLSKTGKHTSLGISGGAFVDLILPRTGRKWSIYDELIYAAFKFNTEYIDYQNSNENTVTETSIGCAYLKMNTMVRFKYPVGKFFIFANAGISNAYAITVKNYKKSTQKFFTTTTIKEADAIEGAKKYEFGGIGGLGLKFKMLSLEFRYELSTGISQNEGLSSKTNRYYCFLGYSF